MTVKLLTEHDLEFLSLKGGCTGLSESTHIKMPHCWKSQVTAHVQMGKMADRTKKSIFYLFEHLFLDMTQVSDPGPHVPHIKLSKDAEIRNQYNQVPQDTNGKVTNSQ